jgi:hypothetical protein
MRGLVHCLVLLAGCAAETAQPPPPDATNIVVTLGTLGADGGFAALAGDQTLVPGAQGGFHVWLEYEITGMAAGQVNVLRTARRISDGKLILKTTNQVMVQPDPSGFWMTPNALPNFMCPAPIGVQVNDQPIHFELQISDDAGNLLATGTADATPHCPDGDQHDFCVMICSGN